MEEGSKKYPDDTYMQVPIKTHMEHLRKHIRDYDNMQDIEDLEHALTRMVIVLAKLGVGEDE
jgi:hypothetical protein